MGEGEGEGDYKRFTTHGLYPTHRPYRIDPHAGLRHYMKMKTQGSTRHGVSLQIKINERAQ